jgi:hypothetical protein
MPWLGSSNSNKSRVVAFHRVGNELFLVEATKGHIVTSEIPQTLILAKFAITAEVGNAIVFDFNTGMSRLLIASEWRASDFEGTTPSPGLQAVSTSVSYLADAQIDEEREQLVIRQIAQVDEVNTSAVRNVDTVEVKYYLSPYQPRENYTPYASVTDFERFGYFEVAPQYVDGSETIYATRFAPGQKITFAVSANTPEDFKQAVRDGVLYWNKAFKESIVEVVDGPEGVVAPDFNYNVVQWITWDNAGFAYADAQADPRTGETLHAQVYLTSVFAVSGRAAAERILRDLEQSSNGRAAMQVGLHGMENRPLCFQNVERDFATVLREAIAADADDARIVKAAQDYVREVVAHEIGHTLGLRHNFAGSLTTEMSVANRNELLKQYFAEGRSPVSQPSSSVMEYQRFNASVFSGDLMTREDTLALPYDIASIQKLYYGDNSEETPVFCTDSHLGKFLDCAQFDEGRSPFEWYADRLASREKLLASTVGETLPTVYAVDTATAVASLLEPTLLAFNASSVSARVLKIQRANSGDHAVVIQAKEREFLRTDAEQFGGIASYINLPALPNIEDPALLPIKKALRTELANQWVAAAESFTNNPIAAGSVGAETPVVATLRQIVTATEGDNSVVEWPAEGSNEARQISLPNYVYPIAVRLRALKLLVNNFAEDTLAAEKAARTLKTELTGQLTNTVGAGVDGDDVATAPDAIARFVLGTETLLNVLP